jgi:hypothetical protein
MNIFTIDADSNITVHATRKAARQTGASVFDTPENLAALIGPDNKRLVEIWNSLTGVTPVRKFASRTVAIQRILATLEKLAVSIPEVPAVKKAETAAPQTNSTRRVDSPKKAKLARKAGRKAGSRKEILLGLISRENGASLDELMAAVNWQKHSVRGFIATLGKTVRIESFKTDQGVRMYKALSSGSENEPGD